MANGGVGDDRRDRRGRGGADGAADRPMAAGDAVWRRRVRVHRRPGPGRLGDLQRPQPRPARRVRRQGDRLRRGARTRLCGVRARLRPGADQVDPAVRAPAAGHLAAGRRRHALGRRGAVCAAADGGGAGGRAACARPRPRRAISRRRRTATGVSGRRRERRRRSCSPDGPALAFAARATTRRSSATAARA